LQGDDNLLRQILNFQRQLCREQGLDESLAGLPHYRAYAQLFDVLHLEHVVNSRFTNSPAPKSLPSRVEETIVDALKVSRDLVKKMRKGISACRRGSAAGWPGSAPGHGSRRSPLLVSRLLL
jgi:hypothetical protein